MSTVEKEILWAELNAQTARIDWTELQRHFARGVVIWVAPDLDLVQVGLLMARDVKTEFAQYMESGKVVTLTDAQAMDWSSRNAELWALVAAPWVLVQERSTLKN